MSEYYKIPQDHPSLEGHFPQNPIVPGVVILDYVIKTAQKKGYNVLAINSAKFISPLLPESNFCILFQQLETQMKFEVQSDDSTIAQGALRVE